MSQEILSIKDLQYTYKHAKGEVKALKGLDLDVCRGEIFGFLGPNGAGKTTTIKLMLGILCQQSGDISVLGGSPSRPGTRKTIGYMPETADYYRFLTPRELLNMYGAFFGIKKRDLRGRIDLLLETVGLEGKGDMRMQTFSKGMMQKVSFAQALVNDPELLILDEPNSGLDPVARKKMREVIQDLRGKGKTIFFSSHELSEVELISDKIGILNKGSLIASGPVRDLLDEKEEDQTLEKYFLRIIEGGS